MQLSTLAWAACGFNLKSSLDVRIYLSLECLIYKLTVRIKQGLRTADRTGYKTRTEYKHRLAMQAEPTKCWFVSKRKQASRA